MFGRSKSKEEEPVIPPPLDINLLQHEILRTLRKVGMTVTAHGSEEKGYNALYKFQEGSASLQFGMLGALVNDFARYKFRPNQPTFFPQMRIKREEVEMTIYAWEDIAKAVEILEFNKHVNDVTVGSYIDMTEREIRLTKEGLIAFDTDFYVKESQKEKDSKLLLNSTLATERAARTTGQATINLYYATIAIVVVTLVVGLIPYFNDSEKSSLQLRLKEQQQLIQSLQKQLSGGKLPPPATHPKDSVPAAPNH
jgi:hypothetical protein